MEMRNSNRSSASLLRLLSRGTMMLYSFKLSTIMIAANKNGSLILLCQHERERVVVTEDNSTYPVANEGVLKIDVRDTEAVKLSDVFHALGLKRNLVSVSQINDSGKYILLGPNDVKIMDNVKNISTDVVLTGENKGSLFVMAVGEVYVKKTSRTDSTTIWDAQLGHLGYQLLRQICSKKLVDSLLAL
ncbi:hypothetical protein KY285_005194 [Solanum tuberosum]|nr:hypothetical protein KY284_005421 [Solanum tuberosum]KAH0752046.1 hypothetical protein KY285_005194 [Solanum tuberosum]